MDVLLRPARADDEPVVRSFTQETFSWGDYVGDAFAAWLGASDGHVLVATTSDDQPVAVARAVLLSEHELWLHGARVHPDWRGRGVGGKLNEGLVEWGRTKGAHVARLLTEEWNEAAQRQVAKSGYRPVSQWLYAHRTFDPADPNPRRNGGKRVPGPERLQTASRSEAEPAFLAWSTSQLMRHARGLFGFRWSWRRLTIEDLVAGAKARTFFECPSGWALMSRTEEGTLETAWIMATPEDTSRLVRAILDYGLAAQATGLSFQVPATVEFQTALDRIGCSLKPASIWERSIDPRTE